MQYWHRHNQELEQDSVSMQQQNLQLEQEAQALAQRLDAVMQDKFQPSTVSFDADTPIDKTLNFLQTFIAVSYHLPAFAILELTFQHCAWCLDILHVSSLDLASLDVDTPFDLPASFRAVRHHAHLHVGYQTLDMCESTPTCHL